MPSQPFEAPTASSRERLLRAAKRLFAAQGYEQTATSAIAREAGTSESQLMRYFGGKIGLLEALFEDAWVHLNARVARAVKSASGSRDALLAALQSIVTTLSRDPDLAILAMFEGRRIRGDEARIRVSRGHTQFADTVRGLVRTAQAEHELDISFDANAVTSAILGAMESMVRDRLLARSGGARNFAEREIRHTIGAMLDGLRPKPAARKRYPPRR
jgi:AcrR family transcriptional regulator